MSACAFEEFLDTVDWDATENKHEAKFWDWCISNSIHNEDYILDNYGDLFLDFALNELETKEFVCNTKSH
jgi:hypothetical protein